MVRSAHVLITLGALALVSGCASILGDFEMGASDGTGNDGGDALADGPRRVRIVVGFDS